MNRLHIIILGACNSGKSSLVNMLTDQSTSLVADTPGTTTDPVRRNMELPEAGPCVFIDTAGFDDDTELGRQRISLTLKALDEADIALLLVGENMGEEAHWQEILKQRGIPYAEIANKADLNRTVPDNAISISSIRDRAKNRTILIEAILRILPSDSGTRSITGGMAKEGDTVVLVMPQDDSAPKGRLILPQVQTIRELLDLKAIPVCTVPEKLQDTLSILNSAPSLIITDSQAFANVYPLVPDGTMLTSFSVLMAAHKGDIRFFAESAQTISKLTESSHVLIAEACTHAPQSEDIGRAKIPALLRKRIGQGLRIDHVSGRDFPDNLTGYDLVIHCGGCMFNRQYLLSRVARAKAQGVPMTNYGITIAHLTGALSKVTLPEN
ncbi:MAG: [FeFe] hydrogenase H-cluster maturation GTPase HydF [Duncaniella freteri]|nr:[FeFe] hydrogenase H-cluster maturation GTPase HydF [Duncaniella freteri]